MLLGYVNNISVIYNRILITSKTAGNRTKSSYNIKTGRKANNLTGINCEKCKNRISK